MQGEKKIAFIFEYLPKPKSAACWYHSLKLRKTLHKLLVFKMVALQGVFVLSYIKKQHLSGCFFLLYSNSM